MQAYPRTATANMLYTTFGYALQPRIDAPVITPVMRAQYTLTFIASPPLSGISATELHTWMANIMTPMHAPESATAARGTTRRPANLPAVLVFSFAL